MKEGELVANRYLLTTKLGNGGQADAFRAWDEVEQRDVVIKTPRLDDRDPEDGEVLRLRFAREAKILCELRHPNIPLGYATGVHNGQPYLVMQLINGKTLDQFTKDYNPIPIVAAAAIGVEIGEALDAAHAAGVVHRDLKPNNVLLSHSGVAHLIDFGIAKSLRPDATKFTAKGVSIGTTGYMPPEQMWGSTITERTDLYTLGCVLYLLIAGQPPFTEGDHGRGVPEQHLNDPPPPFEVHGREVPAELERLVMQLLKKSPEDRPSSAREVIERLQPFLPRPGDSAPVPALIPDPTLKYRLPEEVRPAEAPAAPRPQSRRSPNSRRARAPQSFVSRSEADERERLARKKAANGDPTGALRDIERLVAQADDAFGALDSLVVRLRLAQADIARLAADEGRRET
ncbi:serine/threonine-protein kinase [Lentzea flaviverrucosa]|uniref:non-specific serine/threonine protein kinase n=1 Tax=Lentzea flaviverrucosa TaxID=200379 RepID=A0A1H9WRN2_9PSEU|nr:serine/threonine-protein kinase [Lentzea flaviverrucosa]RDI23041.1 serine/threonine protein kinase [Lentzea flaviverrucosa]SES36590.1 Serine/threonine protein kinase [Lentzea flaviverrucosa]